MLDYGVSVYMASIWGNQNPPPVLWHFIEPGFDERKTNGFIIPDDSKFEHRAGAASF